MRDGPVTELHWLGVAEAAKAIAEKDLSPVELMKTLLDRIAALDPQLNAFIQLDGEAAMQAAKAAEAEATAGRLRGPLHGVPVGIKDIINVAGLPTTGHSKILQDNLATADAVCVEKLRGAGAIVMGKLSTHEFAIGGPSFDCHGHRRAIRGTPAIIPAVRRRARARASRLVCFRWRWAATPAAACAIRRAAAASSA